MPQDKSRLWKYTKPIDKETADEEPTEGESRVECTLCGTKLVEDLHVVKKHLKTCRGCSGEVPEEIKKLREKSDDKEEDSTDEDSSEKDGDSAAEQEEAGDNAAFIERVKKKVEEIFKEENSGLRSAQSRILDLSSTGITGAPFRLLKDGFSLKWDDVAISEDEQTAIDAIKTTSVDALQEWWGVQPRSLDTAAGRVADAVGVFLKLFRGKMDLDRERDYIVKIIAPVLDMVFPSHDEEFHVEWIEKESRASSDRKNIDVEVLTEHVQRGNMVDMIATCRYLGVEFLYVEVAGGISQARKRTKSHQDFEKLRILMKDGLDLYKNDLGLESRVWQEQYIYGLRIEGNAWNFLAMKYSAEYKCYVMKTTVTKRLPMSPGTASKISAFFKELFRLKTLVVRQQSTLRDYPGGWSEVSSPPPTVGTPQRSKKTKSNKQFAY